MTCHVAIARASIPYVGFQSTSRCDDLPVEHSSNLFPRSLNVGLRAYILNAQLLDRAGLRNYDMMTFGNSVLAGLVAITSSCSTVYPWAAIIIGIVAGLVYNIGSEVRIYKPSM